MCWLANGWFERSGLERAVKLFSSESRGHPGGDDGHEASAVINLMTVIELDLVESLLISTSSTANKNAWDD